MATPMTYDQLKAALVTEGLTVKEVAGSRDRCRCHSGSHAKGGPTIRPWGGVNGIMVHITAGNLNGRTPEQYIAAIINGDKELPDKVQLVTDPNGVVYINSAGRSNHAGSISQKSLDASINDTWSLTAWDDKRGSGVDGNAHFYGIENIAASSMTAAQRKASVSICAAIARLHGWTGQESVGHGECSNQRGYADPGLNTGTLRKDVMAQVGAAKPVTPPPVTPPPAPRPTTALRAARAAGLAPVALPKAMQSMYHAPSGTPYPVEDSVPGLALALAKHYPWTDIDIHVTNDGVIVAGHDTSPSDDGFIIPASVKAKYGTHPNIENMPWSVVSTLRTKAGQRYYTLDEIMAWLGAHTALSVALELKQSKAFENASTFEGIYNSAIKHGVDPSRIAIMSIARPEYNHLARFKAAHRWFRTVILPHGLKKLAGWTEIQRFVDHFRGKWAK